MSSQLGPIEITCDAPPYLVVQACASLGFNAPLDVGWWRLSQFLAESGDRGGLLELAPWKWFSFRDQSREKHCACGGPLPVMEGYSFTFVSHKVADYWLGQCPRCGTIFWEQG